MADAEISNFERVAVVFERRSDGGIRIFCDDLPGFVLSNSDAELAKADVIPALETIIGEIWGRPVSVRLEGADGSPKLTRDRERFEYVAQLAA